MSQTPPQSGPTIYLIRHAEKPPSGNGLTPRGIERVQHLREVFGASSAYNISHILAQKPKPDGRRKRPFDTVKPLADDLGLIVDTDCERDDFGAVAEKIRAHRREGKGNVLVCWEHKRLADLLGHLGVSNPPHYPKERFDVIWTCEWPWQAVVEGRQRCPGLDDGA